MNMFTGVVHKKSFFLSELRSLALSYRFLPEERYLRETLSRVFPNVSPCSFVRGERALSPPTKPQGETLGKKRFSVTKN